MIKFLLKEYSTFFEAEPIFYKISTHLGPLLVPIVRGHTWAFWTILQHHLVRWWSSSYYHGVVLNVSYALVRARCITWHKTGACTVSFFEIRGVLGNPVLVAVKTPITIINGWLLQPPETATIFQCTATNNSTHFRLCQSGGWGLKNLSVGLCFFNTFDNSRIFKTMAMPFQALLLQGYAILLAIMIAMHQASMWPGPMAGMMARLQVLQNSWSC